MAYLRCLPFFLLTENKDFAQNISDPQSKGVEKNIILIFVLKLKYGVICVHNSVCEQAAGGDRFDFAGYDDNCSIRFTQLELMNTASVSWPNNMAVF